MRLDNDLVEALFQFFGKIDTKHFIREIFTSQNAPTEYTISKNPEQMHLYTRLDCNCVFNFSAHAPPPLEC